MAHLYVNKIKEIAQEIEQNEQKILALADRNHRLAYLKISFGKLEGYQENFSRYAAQFENFYENKSGKLSDENKLLMDTVQRQIQDIRSVLEDSDKEFDENLFKFFEKSDPLFVDLAHKIEVNTAPSQKGFLGFAVSKSPPADHVAEFINNNFSTIWAFWLSFTDY